MRYLYCAFLACVAFVLVNCSNGNSKPSQAPTKNLSEIDTTQVTEIPSVYPTQPKRLLEQKNVTLDSIYIKPGAYFASLASFLQIPDSLTYSITQQLDSVFPVRKFRARNHLIGVRDLQNTLLGFIYPINQLQYLEVKLNKNIEAEIIEKDVDLVERTVRATINENLYNSILDQSAPRELALRMADIYAWTIDFYRINKGDDFTVKYIEKQLEGEAIGVDSIIAVEFNHHNEPFIAVGFDAGNGYEFFDEKGNSIRKAFLKSPLDFGRISSRYSPRRFHPVQRRWKAHKGTDYAAPTGTPIKAVGDGKIIARSYTRGNGYYVKVRHNSTYTTQYLHMSKFRKGQSVGSIVKQGDVIGYVGSTGLATGPHVCFRFWKNGVQVDHLREKFPSSKPIPESKRAEYLKYMEACLNSLKQEEAPQLSTIPLS